MLIVHENILTWVSTFKSVTSLATISISGWSKYSPSQSTFPEKNRKLKDNLVKNLYKSWLFWSSYRSCIISIISHREHITLLVDCAHLRQSCVSLRFLWWIWLVDGITQWWWWGTLTMPVSVVPCPCKALKWDISMWIEILRNRMDCGKILTATLLICFLNTVWTLARPVDVKPVKEVLDSVRDPLRYVSFLVQLHHCHRHLRNCVQMTPSG